VVPVLVAGTCIVSLSACLLTITTINNGLLARDGDQTITITQAFAPTGPPRHAEIGGVDINWGTRTTIRCTGTTDFHSTVFFTGGIYSFTILVTDCHSILDVVGSVLAAGAESALMMPPVSTA
jgi:hypothetical protein